MRIALLLALLALLAALLLLHTLQTGGQGAAVEHTASPGGCPRPCFAVYYGEVNDTILRWLSSFDLVIVAPTLPAEVVEALTSRGVRVLGYVSATTIGGWEPWARLVPGNITVAGTEWGERVVDPCSPAWRRALGEALRLLRERGYSGVFLDNLDMVEEYPWMEECVVDIVRLAKRYGGEGWIVAVNRGFKLLDRIAGYTDYILFEDFVTGYSPSRGVIVFRGDELEWIHATLERLEKLHREGGPQPLLLAYTDKNWSQLDTICRYWRRWAPQLPLYVAPGPLLEEGRCNPCCSGGGG